MKSKRRKLVCTIPLRANLVAQHGRAKMEEVSEEVLEALSSTLGLHLCGAVNDKSATGDVIITEVIGVHASVANVKGESLESKACQTCVRLEMEYSNEETMYLAKSVLEACIEELACSDLAGFRPEVSIYKEKY